MHDSSDEDNQDKIPICNSITRFPITTQKYNTTYFIKKKINKKSKAEH